MKTLNSQQVLKIAGGVLSLHQLNVNFNKTRLAYDHALASHNGRAVREFGRLIALNHQRALITHYLVRLPHFGTPF